MWEFEGWSLHIGCYIQICIFLSTMTSCIVCFVFSYNTVIVDLKCQLKWKLNIFKNRFWLLCFWTEKWIYKAPHSYAILLLKRLQSAMSRLLTFTYVIYGFYWSRHTLIKLHQILFSKSQIHRPQKGVCYRWEAVTSR